MNVEQFSAAQMYKETSIKTADGGKIIVLLYEEIIKHLKEAINLLTNSDHKAYDQVNYHITKAQEIIMELACALSDKEDKELYDNLLSLYLFFNKQLHEANIQKDFKFIEPSLNLIEELYESWKKITSQPSSGAKPSNRTGINLSG